MLTAPNRGTVAARCAVRLVATVLAVVLGVTAILIVPAYSVLMIVWFHIPSPEVLVLTAPVTVVLLLLAWVFVKLSRRKIPSVHERVA